MSYIHRIPEFTERADVYDLLFHRSSWYWPNRPRRIATLTQWERWLKNNLKNHDYCNLYTELVTKGMFYTHQGRIEFYENGGYICCQNLQHTIKVPDVITMERLMCISWFATYRLNRLYFTCIEYKTEVKNKDLKEIMNEYF